MSRSFKHYPHQADSEGSIWRKFSKKRANRRVRQSKDLPSGKAYKKLFETWNIVDWAWSETWKECEARLREQSLHYNMEEERDRWERGLLRK